MGFEEGNIMNDAMRNAMDGFAANFAANAASNASCLANTTAGTYTSPPPRSLGVREIAQNNSTAMREINCRVDELLEALRGPANQECCGEAKTAAPDSLISEVNRQAAILDEINGKLIAALALLNG